jgi:histidine triad (HIT) family protein
MNDCLQLKSKISEHASEACIFCKIVKGEIPCSKVYENSNVLAFLDIKPINKGHTLVIPKKHFVNVFDGSEDDLCEVAKAVKKVSFAVKKAVEADGLNIMSSNDSAAGQVVMHAHTHLIPRFKDDGLKLWPGKDYEENETDSIKEKIIKFL